MGKTLENFSLQKFNSFGVDIKTKFFLSFETIQELTDFFQKNHLKKYPVLILGEGSNILFTKDYNGVVIHPCIKGIEVTEEDDELVKIRAGCGENWDYFVEYCVKRNLGGLENLSLIPGSVGACPVQNIGAYGVEVKDVIERVEAFDLETGKLIIYKNEDCQFGYRDSIFKRKLKNKVIITGVIFRLTKNHQLITHYGNIEKVLQQYPEKNLKNVRDVITMIRREKLPDPKEIGNAGSFFKNPVITKEFAESIKINYLNLPSWEVNDKEVKLSAAWLIEQCNLKGKRTGNVGAYPKQPLVIVNYGGATGNDILDFSEMIQKVVKKKFNIQLQTEVNIF